MNIQKMGKTNLSRIMKLVAQVSSSKSSAVAPHSNASMILAAWEVEPDASALVYRRRIGVVSIVIQYMVYNCVYYCDTPTL
jgi:hypothetical protein